MHFHWHDHDHTKINVDALDWYDPKPGHHKVTAKSAHDLFDKDGAWNK